MTYYFTSDLHFGHTNILKYCPQRRDYLGLSADPTADEMNEAIVRTWNEQVGPNDSVLVVGDIAMGKVAETINYVRRLNGAKHLIWGNHDRPHPVATSKADKRAEWQQIYADAGFLTQGYGYRTSFDGIMAEVCHFPYFGDHSEDRYNAEMIGAYVPADEGLPLVHGHVHDLWKTNGKMFNLGIDAWDGVFQTEATIGAYFRSIGFTS